MYVLKNMTPSQIKNHSIKILQDQLQRTEFMIKAYILNNQGEKFPMRDNFYNLQENIAAFMQGKSDARWFILSGLRGTGKTTLLAQLYDDCKSYDVYRLYLTLDMPKVTLGDVLANNLVNLIVAYEEIIGRIVENLDKPLFIFLDEVQYESDWGVILKNLYDRARKVFIIATGSQALQLQSNADIARRAFFEHILPLSFSEFLKIKGIAPELDDFSNTIKNLLFDSKDAKYLYRGLLQLQNNITLAMLPIDRFVINKYLHYGTLPSLLNITNETLIYDQLRTNLAKVIMDVARLGKFSAEVCSKIDPLLYLLADSGCKSLEQLSKDIGISKPKLAQILDTLVKTEVLQRISPFASHTAQISKTSKYLFVAPAFRAMYFNFIGSIRTPEEAKGKLLEDVVAMYFNMRKEFHNRITACNYDATENGADFILSMGREKIIVEVGCGNKGFAQVKKTQVKIKSKYNLVISNDVLHFAEECNAVRIPLEMFLLM